MHQTKNIQAPSGSSDGNFYFQQARKVSSFIFLNEASFEAVADGLQANLVFGIIPPDT